MGRVFKLGRSTVFSRRIYHRKYQIRKVLIICIVFIAAACVSLADGANNKKQKSDSLSVSQRYIKEPYEGKDYMMLLGERMSSENRSVLLFGIDQPAKNPPAARRQAAPAQSTPVELKKLVIPTFEQIPDTTIVRPEGTLLAPGNATSSLVIPQETERQNQIVSPELIQPNTGEPADLGENKTPVIELIPLKTIEKPETTLAISPVKAIEKPETTLAVPSMKAIEMPEQTLVTFPDVLFDLDKSKVVSKHQPTYSQQHFKKAATHAGYAAEDIVGVFTLGLGSNRAAQFRGNDGQSFGSYLAKTGSEGGKTISNAINVFYSIGDVILLDSLPNPENKAYQDNHALVRPFVFAGKAVVACWNMIGHAGNTLTFGYFDNVTGSAGMCALDIAGFFIQGCQGVLTIGKGPVELAKGDN